MITVTKKDLDRMQAEIRSFPHLLDADLPADSSGDAWYTGQAWEGVPIWSYADSDDDGLPRWLLIGACARDLRVVPGPAQEEN